MGSTFSLWCPLLTHGRYYTSVSIIGGVLHSTPLVLSSHILRNSIPTHSWYICLSASSGGGGHLCGTPWYSLRLSDLSPSTSLEVSSPCTPRCYRLRLLREIAGFVSLTRLVGPNYTCFKLFTSDCCSSVSLSHNNNLTSCF